MDTETRLIERIFGELTRYETPLIPAACSAHSETSP